MCHALQRDSSVIKFDRAEITFISALFNWLNHQPIWVRFRLSSNIDLGFVSSLSYFLSFLSLAVVSSSFVFYVVGFPSELQQRNVISVSDEKCWQSMENSPSLWYVACAPCQDIQRCGERAGESSSPDMENSCSLWYVACAPWQDLQLRGERAGESPSPDPSADPGQSPGHGPPPHHHLRASQRPGWYTPERQVSGIVVVWLLDRWVEWLSCGCWDRQFAPVDKPKNESQDRLLWLLFAVVCHYVGYAEMIFNQQN